MTLAQLHSRCCSEAASRARPWILSDVCCNEQHLCLSGSCSKCLQVTTVGFAAGAALGLLLTFVLGDDGGEYGARDDLPA